jgi:hypothetical protein
MWLPEIVRAAPRRPFAVTWVVPPDAVPRDPQATVPGAVRRAGATLTGNGGASWKVIVPWRTLVYGFIRRDVDEAATLSISTSEAGCRLRLECDPVETHAAHAAGAAGAIAMAAATWLIGGWTGGLLPAATVLVGASLWADAARTMAMRAFELRLRQLVADVGLELWPTAPAELLPPLR